MLVLTRKRSEMIQIGEEIVVKIIHTGRSNVRIGIDAPQNVRVMRAELCKFVPGNRLHELIQERRAKRAESVPPPPHVLYAAHAACDVPALSS